MSDCGRKTGHIVIGQGGFSRKWASSCLLALFLLFTGTMEDCRQRKKHGHARKCRYQRPGLGARKMASPPTVIPTTIPEAIAGIIRWIRHAFEGWARGQGRLNSIVLSFKKESKSWEAFNVLRIQIANAVDNIQGRTYSGSRQ